MPSANKLRGRERSRGSVLACFWNIFGERVMGRRKFEEFQVYVSITGWWYTGRYFS